MEVNFDASNKGFRCIIYDYAFLKKSGVIKFISSWAMCIEITIATRP